MEDFLGDIYCWFESLFGVNLAQYLWGYNCETQGFMTPSLFNKIGITTIVITFLMVILYYFIINPPHKLIRNWFIALGVLGLVIFSVSYFWLLSDFNSGIIGDCLMYSRDEHGEVVSQLIYSSDILWFGIINSILSMILFFLFSFIRFIPISKKRNNARYSPF